MLNLLRIYIGKRMYRTVIYDLVDRERKDTDKDNYHVIPTFDGYEHIADEVCVCEPYLKEELEDRKVWVHRIMN